MAPLSVPRVLPKQLWMAAHLPRLALEALRIPPDSGEPVALLDGEGRHSQIFDCTAGAASLGVHRNQALSAALALAPALQTRTREQAQEQAALLSLAGLGHSFTPSVNVEAPADLLLEVEGSAHLFGGPVAIRARARECFAARGFTAWLAVAPTPAAACWLAQAHCEITATSLDELRSNLGKLPVQALSWPKDTGDAFARLGVRHLADLLRLPRDGLAKRFGAEFLEMLDQALGTAPDPRAGWQAPRRCRASRELPGDFTSLDHLQPYIEDLVTELCRELRAYDAGADRLRLLFRHWRQTPTAVTVGSAEPCRDPRRWDALLQAQLANTRLLAPVHELQLLSGRLLPFSAINGKLLGDGAKSGNTLANLVDLLRARLGPKQVSGLTATTDARPEWASRRVEPGGSVMESRLTPPRPIHLLASPLPLSYADGTLRHRGATLKLTQGPERIEGGWWDGEEWTRDYYQALSSRGELLWVFHRGRRWFLHGLFS
ncbi:MAG TPA: DNA polymerase Y family protein [Gammaproteobacteria bacterium]|jgi:protein ImuB